MTKLIGLFRLIRIANLLIIALSLSLFYYLVIVPVHHYKLGTSLVPFSKLQFVLFVLSVVTVAAAGNIINDYFDFELDREFKPERPLARGIFSLDTAMYLHTAFALTGIGLGFYLGHVCANFKIGYLYVICVILLYLYSAFLKKVPLAGNIVISGLTAFIFILLMLFEADFLNVVSFESASYAFAILLVQTKFYAGFAFLTSLAREIIKDIEDREGDAEFNINTFAVQFGETAAKIIAVIVLLAIIGALSLFMKGFWQTGAINEFYYFLSAIVLPLLLLIVLLFKAHSKAQYARAGMLLKIIMVLGIFSIPVFYFFNQ